MMDEFFDIEVIELVKFLVGVTLIPPFFELDRANKNLPDIGADNLIADIDNFDTIK
jgi:hypothetical protein